MMILLEPGMMPLDHKRLHCLLGFRHVVSMYIVLQLLLEAELSEFYALFVH